MEFIGTTKGSRQLTINCYLFYKHKTLSGGNTYWECTERHSGNGCKAKIVLNIDNVFQRQVNEHSHPCNPEKVAVVKSRAGMKRAASQTVEKNAEYFN